MCGLVPRDQGYVETRPKQPPSTLEASKRAIASLSLSVPSYLPATPYLLFSRRFPQRDSSLSATKKDIDPGKPSSPFILRESLRHALFSLSLSRSHQRSPPLPRGDPSAILFISSAWQPTTARHCHGETIPFRHLDRFILRC